MLILHVHEQEVQRVVCAGERVGVIVATGQAAGNVRERYGDSIAVWLEQCGKYNVFHAIHLFIYDMPQRGGVYFNPACLRMSLNSVGPISLVFCRLTVNS